MRNELLAILAGGTVGALFALLRLPVPAPSSMAGVLGLLAIVAAYAAVRHFVP